MPRGGFGGRGFGMRRFGAPLMPMGMGMGMGSPLLTTLMAGGLGYALGSSSAQQAAPQAQQAPPYQPYPYQASPAPPQGQVPSADTGRLAQFKLLGELHDSGILTNDEFEREKQRILRSS
jgi:hypothetical protein